MHTRTYTFRSYVRTCLPHAMAVYRDERFLFEDPFDKNAMSRTTRYRLRKRRRQEQIAEESPRESISRQDTDQSYNDDSRDDMNLPVDSPLCDDDYGLILDGCSDGDQLDDQLYCIQDDGNLLLQYPEQANEYHDQVDGQLSEDEPENDLNDEQFEEAPPEEVLYDGSSLTVATSALLIMKFKAKHKLSNEGLQDLLKLIKFHCPAPNKCIASSYLFNKHFGKSSRVSHYFCNSCFQTVDADAEVCPNELCKSSLSDSRSSFTEVPIIPQLKRLLERKFVMWVIFLQ